MTETEAAVVARVQAEIARISQLPVLDLDERADSFATGVRWTLRLIHDALTGVQASRDDDIVVELTTEEFHAAARRALAKAGVTYRELAEQAARHNFDNDQLCMVWHCLGDTLPIDFT